MIQAAEEFNFVMNIILLAHSPQKHHLRPITANYKVYVWVPSNNLRNDHHQKVDAFSKSQAAYADNIDCIDGGAQAWIWCELRRVDRVRNDIYFLWRDARAKGKVLFVAMADSDARIASIK